MHRRKLLIGIFGAVLTASCDDSSLKPADDVRQRLIGRWLEEISDGGFQSRSVVTLDRNGTFIEVEEALKANELTMQQTHAGEWSFDGVNFKRKYTNLNGKNLSNASFGYATYAIKFLGEDSFIGIDNVREREYRFSRIEAIVR
ncbi:hypothetical protein ACIGHN_10885 [Acidovorax sp. NPDC077693]|uniref:hypothetical protein n=1 Tax=unclassified Acidovorax TaxID=2684926 RepID=UPI0037CCA7CD